MLQSQLYGVAPIDPVTFASVAVVLLAVALLACYLPARGAARLDPVAALRCEYSCFSPSGSDGTLRERCSYWLTDHAAIANHRRISVRGTTPVRSAMMIPLRKSTKNGID